jgi:hypothetical protein
MEWGSERLKRNTDNIRSSQYIPQYTMNPDYTINKYNETKVTQNNLLVYNSAITTHNTRGIYHENIKALLG